MIQAKFKQQNQK